MSNYEAWLLAKFSGPSMFEYVNARGQDSIRPTGKVWSKSAVLRACELALKPTRKPIALKGRRG